MLRCLPLFFLLGACSSAPSAADSPLDGLMERYFQARLAWDPLFATRAGFHDFDGRLPDASITAQTRRLDELRAFRAELDEIPADEDGGINAAVLRQVLDSEIGDLEHRAWRMPITNRGGFHADFAELPNRHPFLTVADYDNYVARLRAFPQWTAQNLTLMQEGIRTGWTLPKDSMHGFEQTITAQIVKDPRQSRLWAPFSTFPAHFDQATRTRIEKEGADAILYSMRGYDALLAFWRTQYAPALQPEVGVGRLPGGLEFYRHRVNSFTTLTVDPEDVHERGLKEVARIRAEMAATIERAGFQGSFAEWQVFLRTDPRFYAQSPEELMQRTAAVCKRMDGLLPLLFGRLPRAPYGLKPVPDYMAPFTTTAYYEEPAGDGSRAGFYFVNLSKLESRPLYELEALSLHEAVPGHHLQIAIQQELTDLPEFRKWADVTAFIEGWGLYSERLGLECGFYQDPYSDFGRLSYEMWRACRLVVDTGMHAFGWSRERAIQFMANNSVLSLHNIEAEIDRYITWPGQALAYKTGELKIRELRARAEAALGAKFDVRAFHDLVLGSGPVPLSVLETMVDGWISSGGR
jgi:uncharacterized protein (DUF885 family)